MKRLITFGDSWTAGHGVETDARYKEVIDPPDHMFTHTLRLMNSWPTHLGNMLELPVVNMSVCGSCNRGIAAQIQKLVNVITSEDLVIVMLSYPYRNSNNTWWSFDQPIVEIIEMLDSIGSEFYLVNSFYPTFYQEPEYKSKIDISKFLDVSGCAGKYLIEYEQKYDVSVWEYGSRHVNRQNSYSWGDFHPNYLGYKLIGNYIFELLNGRQISNNVI